MKRGIVRLGSILLVAAAARVALLAPIRVDYDEAVYLRILESWVASGDPGGWDSFAVRWGYFAPAILAVRLFGLSRATVVAVPFAFSLGFVAMAYVLARLVADRRAAVVAGLAAAFFPMGILQAGHPNTDIVLVFWLAAGACLLILAMRAGTVRAAAAIGLAAGIAAGIAYLTKVSAVFFPVLAVATAPLAPRGRRMAVMLAAIAGFGLVVAAEMAAYGIARGDPLLRLHFLRQPQTSAVVARATEQAGVYMGTDLARKLFLDYWITSLDPRNIPDSLQVGLYFWIGFPAVAWALLRRRRALAFLLIWFIGFSLFGNFFPASIRPYRTAGFARARYFAPLIPPMLVLIGVFLVALARTRLRWFAVLGAGAVLLHGLYANGILATDARRAEAVERALARFVASRPEGAVYTSTGDRTMLLLHTAMGIRDRLRPYGYEVTADRRDLEFRELAPGALVVINRVDRKFWPAGFAYPFGRTIPSGWSAIWTDAPRIRQGIRAALLGGGDGGEAAYREDRRITVYRTR
ncbi:MAG: glycosyltransferase family 39 protein [Planctomycetes bacterium]|nr:glycosyltransferase family 39 protein [Planctomycetota bacterium]